MQENNNFSKIISTWRRLSGEETETSVVSMSGDSQPYKKKEEDDFLMPHRSKESATINIGTTVAMADASLDTTGLDKVIEKQDYMRHEIEDTKKYLNRPLIVKHIPQLTCKVFKKYICCLRSSMEYAAAPEGGGDTNENNLKSEKETFNPDEIINNSSRVITESEKESCDNVDSVYLRPPPPGKARSSASVKDEDCGINCLYYTLQCCECVIM